MLKDAIDNIRGAVMICYPMGLPEWDLIRENLEDKEDLSGTSVRGLGSRQGGTGVLRSKEGFVSGDCQRGRGGRWNA